MLYPVTDILLDYLSPYRASLLQKAIPGFLNANKRLLDIVEETSRVSKSDSIETLIDFGAYYYFKYQLEISDITESWKKNYLYRAAYDNRINMVKLLIQHNTNFSGCLSMVCLKNNHEIVDILLDNGASFDELDSIDYTRVFNFSQVGCLKSLLKHGTKPIFLFFEPMKNDARLQFQMIELFLNSLESIKYLDFLSYVGQFYWRITV